MFGLQLPEGTDHKGCWQARGIVKKGFWKGSLYRNEDYVPQSLDLIPDRSGGDGTPWTPEFEAFMKADGLAFFQEAAGISRGDREQMFTHDDGTFHCRCNTNASYGYFYMCAWEDLT